MHTFDCMLQFHCKGNIHLAHSFAPRPQTKEILFLFFTQSSQTLTLSSSECEGQ